MAQQQEKPELSLADSVNVINQVCRKHSCDADARDLINAALKVTVTALNAGAQAAEKAEALAKEVEELKKQLEVASLIQVETPQNAAHVGNGAAS